MYDKFLQEWIEDMESVFKLFFDGIGCLILLLCQLLRGIICAVTPSIQEPSNNVNIAKSEVLPGPSRYSEEAPNIPTSRDGLAAQSPAAYDEMPRLGISGDASTRRVYRRIIIEEAGNE